MAVIGIALVAGVMTCFGVGAVRAAGGAPELLSTRTVGPREGFSLAPAIRTGVVSLPVVESPSGPSEVEAPTLAITTPVANRSTCRTDLGESLMTITMPDIAYTCPVYAGGQATLDSGAATMISVDALSTALAKHPGDAGTLWIAGHRASHGGPFAAVPDLAIGSIVTVTEGTTTATYRVVDRLHLRISNDRVVDSSGHATGEATLDSILRPDHGGTGAARLLLQTCDGDNYRWMVYADLVTKPA